MAPVDNRETVRLLKEKNRLGCVRLVDQYQQRLLNEAVFQFHIPEQDGEEIVNDVLLAVVEKAGTFEFRRGEGDFHLWIMTIFRNRVRDYVRRRSITDGLLERFQECDAPQDGTPGGAELEVVREIVRRYQDSLEEDVSREESGALRAICDALEKLESWERVLLRCRALDVPYDDISRYTGKPVRQLKVYHARVKKKFIEILSRMHPELMVSQIEQR